MRLATALFWVAACASACASGESSDEDAGPPAPAPFDETQCDSRPPVDGLEMLPRVPLTIHSLGMRCGVETTTIVLVNTTDHSVEVMALGTSETKFEPDSRVDPSARFTVSTSSLPRTLEPQDSLEIEVRFGAKAAEVYAKAQLLVDTGDGCQRLGKISGTSLEQNAGGTLWTQVLDFGTLRPKESRTMDVTFTFLPDRMPGEATLSITGPTNEPDVFVVMEGFNGPIPENCGRASAKVQMIAPDAPGPVTAILYYRTMSTTAAGTFSGLAEIPLRGVVKE